MFYALRKVMKFQVDFIWHQDVSLDNYNAVVLPGGFSYGDYLRAGAVARFSPIMNEIIRFAGKGKPVLGICNGFQILTECGLLPGALMRNQDLRFVCRHVYIRTENSDTRFTSFLQPKSVLKIPIAHGEGNYFIDQEGLKALADNQQIIFRYVDQNGDITPEANPNGSLDNIAGIINKQGNVLGMMPHPERAMELLLGSDDGRSIFESLKN
jgi:phosphoribosylformylglycinamidine synthase I